MSYLKTGLLAFLLLLNAAYKPFAADNSQDTASIYGRVSGAILGADSALVLNSAPPLLADSWSVIVNPADITIEVAADGSFRAEISLTGPSFHRLTWAGRSIEIFLTPGSTSEINFNEADLNFAKDHAALNQLLSDFRQVFKTTKRDIFRSGREKFAADLETYQQFIAPWRQKLRQMLQDRLAQIDHVPALFHARTSSDISYFFMDLDMNYPRIHHEITGNIASLPDAYLDTLIEGQLDRPEFLSSIHYIYAINTYLRLSSYGELKYKHNNLPKEKLQSYYQAIRAAGLSAPVRNYLLGEMFRNYRISYGPKDWGRVLAQLEAVDADNPVARHYRKLLDKDMARRNMPDEIRAYKTVDGVTLEAHIFYPEVKTSQKPAAYLFFHGGGWSIGTPEWGYDNSRHMAELGMLAVSFEYRLADVHGSNILDAAADAQSAIQ